QGARSEGDSIQSPEEIRLENASPTVLMTVHDVVGLQRIEDISLPIGNSCQGVFVREQARSHPATIPQRFRPKRVMREQSPLEGSRIEERDANPDPLP